MSDLYHTINKKEGKPMSSVKPLDGVKVLDLTAFEAGTACTEVLAWFGAEVWKVERPKLGELSRRSPTQPDIDRCSFLILNLNKKSITCDMRKPEGLSLIKKLAEQADIFTENLGPGSVDRLGLGYDILKEINPKLIYASIKGFDQNGPYKNYPAFAPVAGAMGGLASMTGESDGKPMQCGVNVADSGAGVMCATAILAALLQRDKTGAGQRIDVAMQDFIVTLGRSNWDPYYALGKAPHRVGNGMPLEPVAPCDMYPCKPFGPNDYLAIMISRHGGSQNWKNFCRIIGREEFLNDPRLATPTERYYHRDIIDPAICEWLKDYTKQEAMDILCAVDIPAGAVLDLEDITNDPNLRANKTIVEVEHPQLGRLAIPGFAPKMSDCAFEYKCSPQIGEHNKEIYKEIVGLSEQAYMEYIDKGII